MQGLRFASPLLLAKGLLPAPGLLLLPCPVLVGSLLPCALLRAGALVRRACSACVSRADTTRDTGLAGLLPARSQIPATTIPAMIRMIRIPTPPSAPSVLHREGCDLSGDTA